MLPPRYLRTDTRVQELTIRLRELALQKGPEFKLPTYRELCDLFGVSQTTLNDALDILELQHVLYRKQGSGIYVSPKIHRKTIGVLLKASLLGGAASPFWGNLWNLLAFEAQRRASTRDEYFSFHMIIPRSVDELTLPEEFIMLSQAQRLHGVISIGVPATLKSALSEDIPWISFAAPGSYGVGQDTHGFIRMGIEHLTRQGCQHIGCWFPYWQADDQLSLTMLDIFTEVVTDLKLTFDSSLVKSGLEVIKSSTQTNLSFQEQGYQLVMDVFGQKTTRKPDGLIIADDMLMDGALAAFQTLGIRLNEELKVITHANAGSMLFFDHVPGVNVIEFVPEDIVTALFTLLDTLLVGEVPTQNFVLTYPRLRSKPDAYPASR